MNCGADLKYHSYSFGLEITPHICNANCGRSLGLHGTSRGKVLGIVSDRGGAQAFVQRLVIQTKILRGTVTSNGEEKLSLLLYSMLIVAAS
ncbi:hypothetical protein KIN20_026261 [Parelaphostrongylus tenuis]|uniref:Uncharacterized protein n=1 Tax=Parelaphostrongylus tenuis TaxID=148309 RepID=A0AAD5NBD4_PARTN|nr:hypothetical protein KIN20_026261 [Parelaphostrongylus tenuis]